VSSDFIAEREVVLEAARRIAAAGLVSGASGNVSRRIRTPDGELFAITASRVPYHRITVNDIVVVDAEVEPVVGDGIPSSEALLHMAIYGARSDVGAVIHTHSIHASAFAVAGQCIQAILDEQVLTLGGAVEVAEYGASASDALARNAVIALRDRAAVLLRHHGVAGVGATLEEAVEVVELVERIAQIRLLSASLGSQALLDDEVVRKQQQVYRMMKGMRE
jgi:L-fuculose-phosphate aldolase